MMTFIAFAAVAVASFLAGVVFCVYYAMYFAAPLKKRQPESDELTAVLDATKED